MLSRQINAIYDPAVEEVMSPALNSSAADPSYSNIFVVLFQRYASTRYIDDVATVILINLVLVHIELMPAIVLNTKPNRMLNRGPFR